MVPVTLVLPCRRLASPAGKARMTTSLMFPWRASCGLMISQNWRHKQSRSQCSSMGDVGFTMEACERGGRIEIPHRDFFTDRWTR
ncbi:hypothetical protein [Oryza sativa Japonica Group]|uniref:Uncharacterized protein B1147A04.16 n=1 Tax=Oryza sativa subsp. japonica TaxID=39947 RepID=Q5JKY5_ORYSJ|nr:hypothetical protein [Oryza sativa Japonica Group]